MKVTVCFADVKVVVPCGAGELTVGDLMEKSVQRYKKAAGRNNDYWIKIQSLKSEGEEAILDADDLVCDVADDRERLIATFEEQDGLRPPRHLITDGTSTYASSVGTLSPPLTFNSLSINGQMNNSNNKMLTNHYGELDDPSDVDVVVTGEEVATDPKLRVRHGSDPALPVLNGDPQKWNDNDTRLSDPNANTIPQQERKPSLEMIKKRRNSRDELNSAFSRFGRNSSRQSISNTLDSDVMYKWAEAQQRMENKASEERETEREEIVIKNDGTPLGIQIIAREENDDDSAYGLVIHGIETGGRAARDGRLKEGDHILSINRLDITEMSFDRAQELLRDAMRTDSVYLTVEREVQSSNDTDHQVTDASKVPPVVPDRAPDTSLSKEDTPQKVNNIIAPTNTRRIGRKLYVQLMKGPQGLGFSITTRDNAVGGKNPIYIKNILPKGAAISDGRCKPGDRLLEVNGIEMTGKTQSEAVSILRSVRLGGVVNLVLSRQDSNSPAAVAAAGLEQSLPREMPEDSNADDPTNAKNKRVLVFDVALNDTGSAGLGVSVKGKTTGNGTDGESKDLGIFIKSVIHGGAASKDGRLRPNDQLLYINEESLISISNSSAMEILRRSMSYDKSPRSTLRLVVGRRIDPADTLALEGREPGTSRTTSIDGEFMGPRPGSPTSMSSRGMEIDMDAMDELFKHPVLNKLNAVENEVPSHQRSGPRGPAQNINQSSSTIPKAGSEVVMIEDADIDDALAQIDAGGPSSIQSPSPPQWLVDTWEKAKEDSGEGSTVDDPYNEFQRDSFARRSFSERHKGSLDAKELAWYKRKYGTDPPKVPPKVPPKLLPKPGKESKLVPRQKDIAISTGSLVKSRSTDNLADKSNLSSIHRLTPDERRQIGPSLGLKKNSSLESLQAAVAEVTTHDDVRSRPRAKIVRGRGCNESFRAAVDRSYEQPLNGNAVNSTSTDSVKDYKENGHAPVRDDRSSRDDYSSVSSHDPVIMSQSGSAKKATKKDKEKQRKSSAFKGFGSMFRFGKNRKPDREAKPEEDDRTASNSLESSDNTKDNVDKYREHQDEPNSSMQGEAHRHRRDHQQQSLKRYKDEESQEARSKAERMHELRQRYQRDHRERRGRYVDDEDSDDSDSEQRDREDEGYADGSPESPRSPHPHSSHGDTATRHAPEYRDRDHERWEQKNETNRRKSSHSQDDNQWPERQDEHRHGNRDNKREERSHDPDTRHRYGRHSVPPYMESRTRHERRKNPDRTRESHAAVDVHAEPQYASVAPKPYREKNVDSPSNRREETSRREETNDRAKVERVRDEPPYATVERRNTRDNLPKQTPEKVYDKVDGKRLRDQPREDRNRDQSNLPKQTPEKVYDKVDRQRPRDQPREDRNRGDWYRDERQQREEGDRFQDERLRDKRNHEDRYWDDRPRNRKPQEDRHHNDRYVDDRYRDDRYRNDKHREDRYRDDRYNDRPSDRKNDRREERREDKHGTVKKHDDPNKIKNSDSPRKRRESETKESENTNGKASDVASKDKKAEKSKTKDNKKEKEKEESKLTRKKSDKKKEEKESKKKGKSKEKEEKPSSEEDKQENTDARRDQDEPRSDRRDSRHHDDRRGDTMDRRHRGERGGGDGRDHRRDDTWNDRRRDGRDKHRSPPSGDKYGHGSLGRPRRRPPHDPYSRGTRESGYQSDHDRYRPDNHNDRPVIDHKGYTNGPLTSNHYREERRPRISSSQSIDPPHNGDHKDFGSLKPRSRSERGMMYSESGLDYDRHDRDAARV